ncbi:DNA polymerase alpha catalytic subunit [Microplitis mediator]|uniref:DNA polymerase alpha catalytic subunit n=1 Tax=Microplitis mediator TaxID=375433 RepID=UPI00255796B6|nr:DNA polymerase alpha catalytic subunit [Microplitis mediator]
MEESPTTSRSKRQKIDKSGRSAALQKLKELKGSKNKYKIEELKNVYDQVDEKEYSKTVATRQESDWIVDDGGSGYVEDGREIFDDDLDDESIEKASKQNLAGPRKRKRDDESKSKGSIVDMFKNVKKNTIESVTSDNDNLLADLLDEIKTKKNPSSESNKSSIINKFKVKPKSSPSSPLLLENKSDIIKENSKDDNNDDVHSPPTKKINIDVNSTSEQDKQLNKVQLIKSEPQQQQQQQQQLLSSNKIDKVPEVIDDVNLFDNYFDEPFDDIIDNTNNSVATTTSKLPCKNTNNVNNDDDDDDDFDAIIGSIDEKNLCNNDNKNRPKLEDDDFNKVIETLDKNSLWSEWDGETTETTKTDAEDTIHENLSLYTGYNLLKAEISGDDIVKFFWWDAMENPYKNPGVVNLFGKIYIESLDRYESCCLSVKNIPRRIYILPKEKIIDNDTGIERLTTMKDVYNEFKNLADNNKIYEFRSSTTTKYYAFNHENTPLQSEYLEVRYSSSYPKLDSNYSGNAIEHIFGTTVNPLELLLIERQIKGPCWLDIKLPIPIENTLTWSKYQLNCFKMENITVSNNNNDIDNDNNGRFKKIPPMVIMAIDVRTTLNYKNNNTEITVIGILINDNYNIDKPSPKIMFNKHYCIITHPKDTNWPLYARDKLNNIDKTNVIICDTETDVLENFLNIICDTDPDLLIGYDCGFQFDIIYRRLIALNIKNLNKIGKLKQNIAGQFYGGNNNNNNNSKLHLPSLFNGRPICDIVVSVKELNIKIRSYDLDSICNAVLKTKENTIKEIKPIECPKFYETTDKIKTLIKITMSEALYILKLMFELNIIPLSLQITCIAGNVLSKTLIGGRAERNEYLLLHAFSNKGYITPDKPKPIINKIKKNSYTYKQKKKSTYTGGLVLEPKRGFYDKLILLMDFNSLYPSIIQEYNICFTTLPGVCYNDFKDIELPKQDLDIGIIPTEIRKLVESRRQVKNLMKQHNLTNELKIQYNIRQLALKLTANSMYGCLGAEHCRFYAKNLAEIITLKGREILEDTKKIVENFNYDVIYGDTDSLMINTNCLNYDKAYDIAKYIKNNVNKHYKMLELDIDGIFKYLLLYQKKKYAAVIINKLSNGEIQLNTEYKGLDIVRRDWCQLACDQGRIILDILFSDNFTEEIKYNKISSTLEDISYKVYNNKFPLESFIITKQLSKNPNDYQNNNNNNSKQQQPHVDIAIRMNKTGGRMWKAGDTISYLICNDGTNNQPNQRAYHIHEFKNNNNLSIDCIYYLRHQIYPVVSRICEPVDMITEILIIKNLGLQDVCTRANMFKPISIDKLNLDNNKSIENNDPLYKNCEPFKLSCIKCNTTIEIKKFLYNFSQGSKPSLYQCINPNCNYPLWKNSNIIYSAVFKNIKTVVQRYYRQNFICNNSKCKKIQRKILISGRVQLPLCIYCGRSYLIKTYTDRECWNQINFYRYIFDSTQIDNNNLTTIVESNSHEMLDVYKTAKEIIESYLIRSRFSLVSHKIFNFARKRKNNNHYKHEPKNNVDMTFDDDDDDDDDKSKDNNTLNFMSQEILLPNKENDEISKVVIWEAANSEQSTTKYMQKGNTK